MTTLAVIAFDGVTAIDGFLRRDILDRPACGATDSPSPAPLDSYFGRRWLY